MTTGPSINQIANLLNIMPNGNPVFVPTPPPNALPAVVPPENQDYDKDYAEVRSNLKTLIEKSTEAVDGMLNVAQESDSPRAYEVVSDLIKTAIESNNKLMDLHKKMKEIKEVAKQSEKNSTNVFNDNRSVFVGNPNELLKLIRQNKNNTTDEMVVDEKKEE